MHTSVCAAFFFHFDGATMYVCMYGYENQAAAAAAKKS